jgi:hypothetical protein
MEKKMTTSNNSLEPIPPFLAISAETNKPLNLPKNIIWDGITLGSDELIVYINEKGEHEYITTLPFDENKLYKIIIFDYSS